MAFSRFTVYRKDISVIGVYNTIILLEAGSPPNGIWEETQIPDDGFIRSAGFSFCTTESTFVECNIVTNPSSAVISLNLNPVGSYVRRGFGHPTAQGRSLSGSIYNGAVRFPVSRFPVTVNRNWATTTMQNTLLTHTCQRH